MPRLVSLTTVAAIFGGSVFAIPGLSQSQPAVPQGGPSSAGIVRAVLASTPLPSVADAPRHFKLARVSLPAKQATTYRGSVGFVFTLSGSLEVTSGTDRHLLGRGDGLLVAAGKTMSFKAGESEPAVFLHYALMKADELGGSMEARPATVSELYRTESPIPGLKTGPYEFTLVRVTFPPRLPSNPLHHRSGAALYYVLNGTGAFKAKGRESEPRPAGTIQYEPSDLVHQWGNPADTPLVLIQMNISQEGVPVVIFEAVGAGAVK